MRQQSAVIRIADREQPVTVHALHAARVGVERGAEDEQFVVRQEGEALQESVEVRTENADGLAAGVVAFQPGVLGAVAQCLGGGTMS